MGGNVSEGRGPLPLLPQNCRRGALPALSKGVYPCPQPFPAQSTFCYESHLNAEVFQSLLWEETCTPSRNLHLTTFPQRRRSFGRAFATVAEAFDLTEENCPTNGAFLRDAALAEEQERGTVLYGLSDEDGLSGCMALKRKDEATFSLEKLAVAPWSRNRGYGGALVAHAVEEVRRSGGGTICIGAMYENRKLVRWYERQGFSITGTRKFAHLPFVVCFMEKSV